MWTTEDDHGLISWGEKEAYPSGIPELTEIITADPQFRQMLAALPLYAASELPILLTGEPGTGKELVAEAISALSPARRRSFYRINCAALTESLACSELFGHLRGSFTDARSTRPGKFKLAHQGTLFLDEVGDLPLAVQPRLLRAVEQGEIEPVGSDETIQVDVRLIAATNHDLPQLIVQGRFRQDLYDRLAVLVIHLPPLREREGDIMVLARHFARKTARRYRPGETAPRFTSAASRRLEMYPWPGNVRELKNVITRTVLFSSGDILQQGDISFLKQPAAQDATPSGASIAVLPPRPSRGRLQELLNEEGGNVSALSRRLRVSTKTIYRWLRFHHLDLRRIRDAVTTIVVATIFSLLLLSLVGKTC